MAGFDKYMNTVKTAQGIAKIAELVAENASDACTLAFVLVLQEEIPFLLQQINLGRIGGVYDFVRQFRELLDHEP